MSEIFWRFHPILGQFLAEFFLTEKGEWSYSVSAFFLNPSPTWSRAKISPISGRGSGGLERNSAKQFEFIRRRVGIEFVNQPGA